MPMLRPRDSGWLAATALAAVGGLFLAGCTDSAQTPEKADRQPALPAVPQTEQPVAGPGEGPILPGRPLEDPGFGNPADRPNLLMITADDAAPGDMEHMPHLQRLLADQGATLTRALAPTPICVPARASLITGQYAHNHGALTISGAGGGYASFDDENTLPVWLQESGYDTMFVGKYLNGYGQGPGQATVPPGWTEWRATEDLSTYSFVTPTVNENGTSRTYEQYSSDLFRDLTDELISDPARQDRPWYLWVNYVAPHTGGPDAPDDPSQTHPDDASPVKTTTPAPEDVDTFDWLELPGTPNMFEEDTSDKALIRGVGREWSPDRRDQLREAHQQRIESLQAVDRAIASAVATLRRTGQLDETYIVFSSDNGYVTGQHNLDGKLWYFREITEVPTFVRGPGVPRGLRTPVPVTMADWAPTFAALAGAEPGRTVDGVDVMPWLGSGATHRVVPIEAYPVKGGREPVYTGVIAGPWTYVENRAGRAELYNRDVDPWEEHNLRRDPRYADQVRELARLTAQYIDCAGDGCPTDFYR